MNKSAPHRTDPSSGSPWVVVSVVAAAAGLGLFVLGGFYLVSRKGGTKLALTDQDRQLLVTIGDLQPLPADFVVRTEAVRESKTRYKDGAILLDYRYDHPEKETLLQIRCRIAVKPTEEEARSHYDRQLTESPRSSAPGIEHAQQMGKGQWWEGQHFGAFDRRGEPCGYYLVWRQDRVVFCLEILAEGFEAARFEDLASRCIDQLDILQPMDDSEEDS